MKQNNILYFFMGCVMMMASCNQSPNNTKTPALAEDDRPPSECTDADRTFSVRYCGIEKYSLSNFDIDNE